MTRRSAKCLVVDAADRVLLFRGVQPDEPAAEPWWFCPGGGLDEGETFEAAARRELAEETGIEVDDVGTALFDREHHMVWAGRTVHQLERYFLVRVGSVELCADGWTDEERQVITGHRWWTLDELRATDEVVYPDHLADRLTAALQR